MEPERLLKSSNVVRCVVLSQNYEFAANVTLKRGSRLAFHPVDNLLWGPLRYRLHVFFSEHNDRDESVPKSSVISAILNVRRKKRKKRNSCHIVRNRSVLFVCVCSLTTQLCRRTSGGWTQISPPHTPPTAPHRPVWDQCCIHVLPGILGNITTHAQNNDLASLKISLFFSNTDKLQESHSVCCFHFIYSLLE